eukprot:2716604-Rhodomonas_salina.1
MSGTDNGNAATRVRSEARSSCVRAPGRSLPVRLKGCAGSDRGCGRARRRGVHSAHPAASHESPR